MNDIREESRRDAGTRHSSEIHPDICFGCGAANARGLGMDFPFNPDTRHIRFRHVFTKEQSNTPITVHGGILYTVLDEAMGAVSFHLGQAVMTKSITMEYIRAVPIDTEVIIDAWIEKIEKRYVGTIGRIIHRENHQIYCQALGLFTRLPFRMFRRFVPDRPLAEYYENIHRNYNLYREFWQSRQQSARNHHGP